MPSDIMRNTYPRLYAHRGSHPHTDSDRRQPAHERNLCAADRTHGCAARRQYASHSRAHRDTLVPITHTTERHQCNILHSSRREQLQEDRQISWMIAPSGISDTHVHLHRIAAVVQLQAEQHHALGDLNIPGHAQAGKSCALRNAHEDQTRC